jgi:hypothetical protein
MFGREVFPPSMIVKDMNLSGRSEAVKYLQQQEQSMQQQQQETTAVQHAFEEAKLKEMYTKAVSNIAMARERHSRSDADLGLFEERLSSISKNHAMATNEKMAALEKLVNVIGKYGEIETALKMNELQSIEMRGIMDEEVDKTDAKRTSAANEFASQMMSGMTDMPTQQNIPQMNPQNEQPEMGM